MLGYDFVWPLAEENSIHHPSLPTILQFHIMKQSFLFFIPILLFCAYSAHSQYLGILVNDGSTQKQVGIIYLMSPFIEAKVELRDDLGIELTFIEGHSVQSSASLLPIPYVGHQKSNKSPMTGINNELVIVGSLPTCSIQPETLFSTYDRASGLLEERLLAATQVLESSCPGANQAEASLFWTDHVTKEKTLIRLNAQGDENMEAPSTQLSEALSPYLISHLKGIAEKSAFEIDESLKKIMIKLPEELLAYQTQLKIMDDSGHVIRHQALNRPLTEVLIRKDQWTSPFTFQILFQNDSVLWKETWNSSKPK